jgi:hypothetical protein
VNDHPKQNKRRTYEIAERKRKPFGSTHRIEDAAKIRRRWLRTSTQERDTLPGCSEFIARRRTPKRTPIELRTVVEEYWRI